MTWLCDTTELIPGGWLTSLYAGHGVQKESIPADGPNGPPFGRIDAEASDAGQELRWLIVSRPSAGDLTPKEDSSFRFENAPPGIYSFYVNGYRSGVSKGQKIVVIIVGAQPAPEAVTLRVTESDALTVLRSFLLSILPDGVEVVKGQTNLVPEPLAGDFVVITSIMLERLSTNVTTVDDVFPESPGTRADVQATKFTVQVDVHGDNSQDNTQRITTLFRSDVATDKFASTTSSIAPLYHSNPRQLPFKNGEMQIEYRWTFDVEMECKPIVTTAQDFAAALELQVFEVDVTYPPAGD